MRLRDAIENARFICAGQIRLLASGAELRPMLPPPRFSYYAGFVRSPFLYASPSLPMQASGVSYLPFSLSNSFGGAGGQTRGSLCTRQTTEPQPQPLIFSQYEKIETMGRSHA